MTRIVTVAAAQVGPIARDETRGEVVDRLLALMHYAAARGAELVVFPELTLTTSFARWDLPDDVRDSFFETEMPGPETQLLFDDAARLGVGFVLGYAELTPEGVPFNTSILVERDGTIVGRYREVHLPGHEDDDGWRPFPHRARRYFEPGPEGFAVHDAFGGRIGLALGTDRRRPETYRALGRLGVELVCIGHNTPVHDPVDPGRERLVDLDLDRVMAAGARQHGMWVVGVAKAGCEEGVDLLGDSRIIAPSGEVVASCRTPADEVVLAPCDLDACADYEDARPEG